MYENWGLTNVEIETALDITPRTAANYFKATTLIIDKLKPKGVIAISGITIVILSTFYQVNLYDKLKKAESIGTRFTARSGGSCIDPIKNVVFPHSTMSISESRSLTVELMIFGVRV